MACQCQVNKNNQAGCKILSFGIWWKIFENFLPTSATIPPARCSAHTINEVKIANFLFYLKLVQTTTFSSSRTPTRCIHTRSEHNLRGKFIEC